MKTSACFSALPLTGANQPIGDIRQSACAQILKENTASIPSGTQTYWGIPFACGDSFLYATEGTHSLRFASTKATYLILLHASETPEAQPGPDGLYKRFRGAPQLMEPICDYILQYADGSTHVVPIRTRMEINDLSLSWGQAPFLSLSHVRSKSFQTATEDIIAGRMPTTAWGASQFRVCVEGENQPFENWLYALENPCPEKEITGIDVVARNGGVYLFGITAGHTNAHPLRYGRRRKAIFTLGGDAGDPFGLIDIDLGHIISVLPRPLYDAQGWETGMNCDPPPIQGGEYIVEFSAHEDAVLYLGTEGRAFPVRDIDADSRVTVPSSEQPVKVRVLDENEKPVPVKIHMHGAAGEYLPPRNRHRIPNPFWFEDYSVDFVHDRHWCTYIDGTAEYLLPMGEVFIEVSKGFEIRPIRTRRTITADTKEITIRLERAIDWRSRGWVTADTHVHFLSPQTALLEGEAEGVNVVNLLASQWGELFTNVGEFTGDGETARGDYMVRVGTENRQHVMGHISLLGYEGAMILPLTTGGPDESAHGDPMEMTLTQWAEQCRRQGGLSILPHFPNPRGEAAAAIVSEMIDGVEATSWGALYGGINPYYLSDWYRYLNCGYRVPAVGGTDKMSANTAIGAMRTYARIDGPLTYASWKDAIRAGRTFVTSSALIDMRIDGHEIGGALRYGGEATLSIEWEVASATIPVTAVELVVNGDTLDGARFDGLLGERKGTFTLRLKDSAWIALRVRGCLPSKPEIIIAHTSATFAIVRERPIFSGPDAATILDQIEGVTAYVKTLATRARETEFKLALAALTGAHRALHNRMHAQGHYHYHSPMDNHPGHENG